ncbi:MAG: sodium:proton antiporter [Burkholderiaceae bacterium]|nr:sodium:proton antiporter [Burkholderiaceae bacterium]
MLSLFDIVAILLTLTACFAWINQQFLRLPLTIGLLLMGLGASLILVGAEAVLPQYRLYDSLVAFLDEIDFQHTLLDVMLAFLLFAGALNVDYARLRRRALPVGLTATIGVGISTVLVGLGMWWVSGLLDLGMPLAWAFVFGALISPTDPVAVLSTLREVEVPESIETDMAGESLFNDGIGIVLFTVLVALASGNDSGSPAAQIAQLFFYEAIGGGLLGAATGYVAYRATRGIDEYAVETMISIALAMGTYSLAQAAHVSGPISVVVAGIFLGNRGAADAMSERTQRYLFSFWTLVDEILNSVLFLLIGLEVLVLRIDPVFAWVAAAAVPVVLLARWTAVAAPVAALRTRYGFADGSISIRTWGGLRGGISIALALSLPEVSAKPELLAATYAVVLFTMVVQGLTLQRVARWATREPRRSESA